MENPKQVEFGERFAELRELRDSEVLERQDPERVRRLREDLMHKFVESPEEVLHFYQNAYLRYKESTDSKQTEAARPPLQTAETIEEANDFFREFGSFVTAYARGQHYEDSPLQMRLVVDYPEEVVDEAIGQAEPEAATPAASQEDVAAPEEETYTPWVVRNTVTGERTPLPDELTEAVLIVLLENDAPLDTEEISVRVFDRSLGEIDVVAKDVTPVMEWIYKRVTADSGPHLVIADKDKGRWKKYLLEDGDNIEWEAPGTAQTPLPETATVEDETDETAPEDIEAEEVLDTLSPLAKNILSYAKSGEPFRMEELRKAIPTLRDMPKDDYDDFKHQFEQVREHIVDFLESQGIKASWELSGKARGRKYRLVMEATRDLAEEKAAEITEDVPAAEQPIPEAPAPEIDLAAIAEQMEDAIVNNPNLSRAELFEKLNINDPETQQQIVDDAFPELQRRLVAKGQQLVSSKPNGDGDNKDKRYDIEQIPMETARTKKGGPASKTSKAEKKTAYRLRQKHLKAAVLIFNRLAVRHVEQGVPVKNLKSDRDITRLVKPDELNPFLRRLQAEGIIDLVEKRIRKTPLSKATKIPHARFIDQETKDKWKNEREEIVRILKELIE